MESKPLVVITGVSGYLGSQTCLAFLKDGSYRVRGTVRSTSNQAKIKPIADGLGEFFAQLELVEADLMNEASLIAACEGATYVVHTASPFQFKDDNIGPAVAGTTAVMKACTQHGVKRVVITSSCAAICGPADEDKPAKGESYDESHWSNPDRKQGLGNYMKSKTLAEKCAWDYQTANPGFEIATINPTFIMGPSLASGDGTSEGFIKAILDGKKKEIPRGGTGFVDVRDCALAHLKAVKLPEAANKRFILYHARVPHVDYYGWLQRFNEKGAKVPTVLAEGEDPTEFDIINNTRSKEVLGIEYTPLEKTFVDSAEAIMAKSS